MQLSNLLALLPLAATAVSGSAIPRDLGDGAEAYVKIGEIYRGPSSDIAARSVDLNKRDSNGGTGHSFPNHNDYNTCTNTWRNMLQNGFQAPPTPRPSSGMASRSSLVATTTACQTLALPTYTTASP